MIRSPNGNATYTSNFSTTWIGETTTPRGETGTTIATTTYEGTEEREQKEEHLGDFLYYFCGASFYG